MDIGYDPAERGNRMAAISVEDGESVFVLHPRQIVAFRGKSAQREDSLLNLSGIYRKKKLIKSRIRGPAQFMLGLPDAYYMKAVPIEGEDDLLFDFRNVLFFSESITYRTHVQKVRNALITRDFIKMQFKGPGTLGLVTAGPLYDMELQPEEPLFVDVGCLVAYPRDTRIRLCVYGNTLASQHMHYQWEMTGKGRVLLQPCKPDPALDEQMQTDSFLRRLLREAIPFGGVFIR